MPSATPPCRDAITYYTTLAGARAACVGMQHMKELQVYDLQELHARLPKLI